MIMATHKPDSLDTDFAGIAQVIANTPYLSDPEWRYKLVAGSLEGFTGDVKDVPMAEGFYRDANYLYRVVGESTTKNIIIFKPVMFEASDDIVPYEFYFDAGHGWLKVEKSELHRIEIADKISVFSYSHGHYVYLEEDRDASIFIQRKRDLKEAYRYVEVNDGDDSEIRSYRSYAAIANQKVGA